ncbi:MAG TPA: Ppx/GppA phosphatase family protein [Baekduia sp.]|nr:Ppx/GppA phosphatase family protein [Baekduia sp.]
MLGLLSRPRGERRIAVCDLGSNSFRLVVFEATGERWHRTDEIYEAVRVGAGLAATGKLSEKGIERALATLDVFAHFCAAAEVTEIDAVATSAIRDAENASELIQRSPLPIRVLSRDEEAYYGYLAAVNSTSVADGCVLDLGGGSMQLISVAGRLEQRAESWALGAVRMTERFDLAGPATRKQLKLLREHVTESIGDASWTSAAGSNLAGIGGTVRNLAAAAQRADKIPEFGVQGFVLDRAMIGSLIERLMPMTAVERSAVPGIKPSRGDLILAGAVVIDEVMAAGGFDAIQVTEAGLREGVFFSRHFAGDPPLLQDVRAASVRNLEAQHPVDPPGHVEHVAHLALELFDGLAQAGLHAGDPVERELLWAACELHDIGMTVAYDDHHKHSRYLILNAGLAGFSPREVALIAQAVRYHRKGIPDPGPFSGLLVGKDDRQQLLRMATLLRLAEGFERARDRSVTDVGLDVSNGAVKILLETKGDARVSRWAAGRETQLFERAFARELVL